MSASNWVIQVAFDYPPSHLWGVGPAIHDLCMGLAQKLRVHVLARAVRANCTDKYWHADCANLEIERSSSVWDRQFLEVAGFPRSSFSNIELLSAWNYRYLKSCMHKYKVQQQKAPVCVHNHCWQSFELASNLAKFFDVPLISTVHFVEAQYQLVTTSSPTMPEQFQIREQEARILRDSAAIIFPSAAMQKHVMNNYKSHSAAMPAMFHIVPLPVKQPMARSFKSSDGSPKTRILSAGRIVPGKGIEDLLDVAKFIVENYADVEFVIVGDGSLFEALKNDNCHPQIRFVGRLSRTQLEEVMLQSDIFCSPSVNESFGLTIVEAMAAGLPIIAGGGESLGHPVEHMKTGLLCAVTENTNGILQINKLDLSRNIRTLIDNKELAKQLGRNSQRVALEFVPEKIACQTLSIYEYFQNAQSR